MIFIESYFGNGWRTVINAMTELYPKWAAIAGPIAEKRKRVHKAVNANPMIAMAAGHE